jgi:hypothetical protein
MRGDNYNDNELNNHQGPKNKINKEREKSGLIPITAKILNDLTSLESGVEYQGISIYDVLIAGTLVDVNQQETRLKLKIWDSTGIAEVVFYNRNEFETLSDLYDISQRRYFLNLSFYNFE